MLFLSVEQRTEFDTSTTAGQTRLDRAINFAYLHVSEPSVYRHHELQEIDTATLVEDDHTYDLSSNVYVIHSVKNTTGDFALRSMSYRDWVNLRRRDAGPTRYARWGNTLYLDNDPTSEEAGDTLTINHWIQPAILSSTSDVTVLNPLWDQIIWTGSIYYAYLMIGQRDKAEAQKIEFSAQINEFKEKDAIEGEDYGNEIDPSSERGPYMGASRGN
tara:strand:+ start:1814 stop:2461 length:648 start_codon:yes stop_codon:yes gene_type:complete